MPRALITGITGQDGSYLAELLLLKGYEVHGVIRRSSSFNTGRIDHVFPALRLYHGDVTDAQSMSRIVAEVQPDEVYNLAAQSHVAVSFECPAYTAETVAIGALHVLEAVRNHCPGARYYQASTSEMFGNRPAPQSEETPFEPRSPYAAAKLYAHNLTAQYREAYGLHASCGILFNHESPRRGETFVTRKVARAVARIAAGLQDMLEVGNPSARRDWGWAPEYVDAMWRMLQQDAPGDYAIATGESHSVAELIAVASEAAGLTSSDHWCASDGRRPLDVDDLRGDASKARAVLGWAPTVGFREIVREMVRAEMEALG